MQNNFIFPINTKCITDLFRKDLSYTFLVGAGISMDSPSEIPPARELIQILFEKCVPVEEINKINQIKEIRFEHILDKFEHFIDRDLKFMEYFDLINLPNFNHYMLANALLSKSNIITTNFDFLLEIALTHIIPQKDKMKIIPVITKIDFEKYPNPELLFKEENFLIYKIHGSSRNYIKNTNTRESLINTISKLGKDRIRGEIFGIEPYKRPAIINLLRNRILVIMGYSGSDDLDIMPFLQNYSDLAGLIWINHINSKNLTLKCFQPNLNKKNGISSKIEKILEELSTKWHFPVYMISGLTREISQTIIAKHMNFPLKEPLEKTSNKSYPSFKKWISLNYSDISIDLKYAFITCLYQDLGQLDSAIKTCEKGFEETLKNDYKLGLSWFSNQLGLIYDSLGNYDKALYYYAISIQIAEKSGDTKGLINFRNNIAMIYQKKGKHHKALPFYLESLKYYETIGDQKNLAVALNNIGMIYCADRNLNLALSYIAKAYRIHETLHDLKGKIIDLNNIGAIYDEKGNYQTALQNYYNAFKISDIIANSPLKATCLNNIGTTLFNQGNNEEALVILKEALSIQEKIGNQNNIDRILKNILIIKEKLGHK